VGTDKAASNIAKARLVRTHTNIRVNGGPLRARRGALARRNCGAATEQIAQPAH